MGNNGYSWVSFYQEFADKLLLFKDDRKSLLEILHSTFQELNLKYPLMEHDGPFTDTCPFTVLGSINRGISDANRTRILESLSEKLVMVSTVPTDYRGVPFLNNLSAWFIGYREDRKPEDIDNLWKMFEIALSYADNPTEENKQTFSHWFDTVKTQIAIKWNLTLGLFWIRPNYYIGLDERRRRYILNESGDVFNDVHNLLDIHKVPSGETYLKICELCRSIMENHQLKAKSLYELSDLAWKSYEGSVMDDTNTETSFLRWFAPILVALRKLGGTGTPEQVRNIIAEDMHLSNKDINETRGKNGVKRFDNEVAFARKYLVDEEYLSRVSERGIWELTEKGKTQNMNPEIAKGIVKKWDDFYKKRREGLVPEDTEGNNKRFWLYAAGNNSYRWEDFYKEGIMAFEFDDFGDLRNFPDKSSIRDRLIELNGQDGSYKNLVLYLWQFVHVMKEGDVVYVKKGLNKLVGRGIVTSDYVYDPSRKTFTHIRQVQWTDQGEWDYSKQVPQKALTDITDYIRTIQEFESFFSHDPEEIIQNVKTNEPYSKKDFLDSVFMSEEKYDQLEGLLRHKKNLILQGAPGVGKTFLARRLAYSLMKEIDTTRVKMVQFHQSYSYEDFIMGYRPSKEGFELVQGRFYEFCRLAEEDEDRDYYFIIDEINRGNLSKIFGELMMLIENDKRGHKLPLLYTNENFSVPSNLYIIGTMNTADRSLAILDYALRRRFAFFEIEPAFDSEGFKQLVNEGNNKKLEKLVDRVKMLNDAISKDISLGNGFRIGHSYLCVESSVSDNKLKSIVQYEICPLLEEYWFDEPDKISYWSNQLLGTFND